ncbi:Zinc finger CCCH domain-containing protein 10 [Halotydeus destructor]|nr:Zinc finger CCCH domain-containing protein 10 [Halotydeus destructor]
MADESNVNNELGLNMSNLDPNMDDDNVCRDFLRNVCRRGNVCRYRHPDVGEAEELGKKIEYVFCHDFQNRECRRNNCRFIHCTKQEEEVYRANGKLPTHIIDKLVNTKGQDILLGQGEHAIPICKDFLKGECRRGSGRCKFRHISQNEADMELRGAPQQYNGSNGHSVNHGHHLGMQPIGGASSGLSPGYGVAASRGHFAPGQRPVAYNERPYDGPFVPPEAKRRALDNGQPSYGGAVYPYAPEVNRAVGLAGLGVNGVGVANDYDVYGGPVSSASNSALNAASALQSQSLFNNTRYLEEENTALRRRIDELKKQVADLMATNEFLLEQNAQLRNMTKGAPQLPATLSSSQAGAQPPPLPTITDLLPPAVSSALLATGLPISSIAAALSTSVSSSTQLVSYPINSNPIMSVSDRLLNIPHSMAH